MSALLAQADPSWVSALAAYGLHLGMAFQLVDDVLDYHADPETLGKEPGRDLLEGKMTMPMVHALQHSARGSELRRILEGQGEESLEMVRAFLEEARSFEYTLQIARSEVDGALQALSVLPPSPFKEGLSAMARFALERQY
jgi:octaprenyl-diphosphate synthase